jgi:hypothetical protein
MRFRVQLTAADENRECQKNTKSDKFDPQPMPAAQRLHGINHEKRGGERGKTDMKKNNRSHKPAVGKNIGRQAITRGLQEQGNCDPDRMDHSDNYRYAVCITHKRSILHKEPRT